MSVDEPAVRASASWRAPRNLADIAILGVFMVVIPAVLASLVPASLPISDIVFFFGPPVLAIPLIWLLLRLQGQRFSDIGLKRVDATDTIMQGVALAALLFSISLITEALGFVRDFSSFRAQLEGKPFTLLLFVIYAFIGAGLYEELAFRGLALDRFARTLGETRGAWVAAAVLQGILFGLAHAYQGVYAIFYTGGLSILFAAVLLLNGRNLWALVLGHGLYDATRFIFFYVMWTYFGK
jgi:membrane protease YdiL (CAAX protease family)